MRIPISVLFLAQTQTVMKVYERRLSLANKWLLNFHFGLIIAAQRRESPWQTHTRLLNWAPASFAFHFFFQTKMTLKEANCFVVTVRSFVAQSECNYLKSHMPVFTALIFQMILKTKVSSRSFFFSAGMLSLTPDIIDDLCKFSAMTI